MNKKNSKKREKLKVDEADEDEDDISELKHNLLPRVLLHSASSAHTTSLFDAKINKVCLIKIILLVVA